MKATSIADLLKLNTLESTNSVIPKTVQQVSVYQNTRNEDIISCLKGHGYDTIMIPDESELTYINSIFQNKGFNTIDGVTSEAVDNIGKQNFAELDNKLKQFTSAMSGVKAAGIFSMMSDLSKDIDDVNIEDVLNRAVTAKPTLLSYFFSLFDKNAKQKSVSQKLDSLSRLVKDKSGNVESKLQVMEGDLKTQRAEQEQNIKILEQSYKAYLETFMGMRRQFGLIVFLEHSYKQQLEEYKQRISNQTDLIISQKIGEYERVMKDIENRRLLIHKTMIQLPLTAKQAETLIEVCKNLMQEINTTLISSFPSIRGNLTNLYVCISAQKAMIGNNLAADLENKIAEASAKATGHLAVQTEMLAANARKREAETMQKIVTEMKANKATLDSAKSQSKQIIQDASNVLINLAEDVKLISTGV